jgi:hypothetical protein
MLQFASQAEQFRAKADMCFAWSKRLPDPEYQRIYYDLAVEWSRLTAFKNARLKTQPQPIILENSQTPKITTARTAGPRHPHRTSKKISFFGSIRPPYNLDQA